MSKPADDSLYLDISELSLQEIRSLSEGSDLDRLQRMQLLKNVDTAEIRRAHSLSLFEETICMLFLAFGVPAGAITVPIATFLIGKFCIGSISQAFFALGILLLPLLLVPQSFSPQVLQSWIAIRLVKYFSYRVCISPEARKVIVENREKGHSQIFVAPPHGVFPYGNLCALVSWPVCWGHHLVCLTTNAALNAPVFKQILGSLGFTDASKSSARRALETAPYAIGISTGGVREIFETKSTQECILLRERYGVIKLAIRTGSDLIPCYVFGNTQHLSFYAGESIGLRGLVERLSRSLGVACVMIFGRYGLPIPRRVPVLGVVGNPIPTKHLQKENPTQEEVDVIQGKLITEMNKLFDRYKTIYGWEDKTLLIK